MIRRLSLVLGFLFFLPLAGHAAEPKPIISIEAPVFFGNLRIDDGLRRFPMLYAYIFAEAKEKLVANQRDAELDLAGVAPDQYNHWSDDIHYELRAAVGPFVSVEQNETSYTGGAHANAVVTTLLWNLREQRPATLADLFTESADDGPTLRAFYKLAENDLARTLKKIGEPAPKTVYRIIRLLGDRRSHPFAVDRPGQIIGSRLLLSISELRQSRSGRIRPLAGIARNDKI